MVFILEADRKGKFGNGALSFGQFGHVVGQRGTVVFDSGTFLINSSILLKSANRWVGKLESGTMSTLQLLDQ